MVAELKSKIKLMPLHAFVMIFSALFSFVSIFIPMFQLFVQYVPVRNYSLFTLILSPYYQSKLRSGPVDLNFQTFAAWIFVVSIVLAVAALTLSASYPFYSESKGKKRSAHQVSPIRTMAFRAGRTHSVPDSTTRLAEVSSKSISSQTGPSAFSKGTSQDAGSGRRL